MNGTSSLAAQVRSLLGQAAAVYTGTPQQGRVEALSARLDEPLRVAIAGKVKAGKSTLLNALVGENLAPTDAGECTRIVTWYRNGLTYTATVERRDGTTHPARFVRESGGLEVLLDGVAADDVRRLVVEWPSTALAAMTLIDTPGIGSLSADVHERARDFLAPSEEAVTPADAVVYLMRHLHRSDARFLESFHDDEAARAAPVNAIGVLSRADEVGGGRLDSLTSARRIAARYRTDGNVRRLCQTVVPVAGLLAQVSATLTEIEYRAVARLASIPATEAEALLVSTDRFVSTPSSLGLGSTERDHLLARFGIFGLRLANQVLREASTSSARMLADELRRASGLDDLRRELTNHFALRRDLLKARSTLLALEALTRSFPVPGSDDLAAATERIYAGAHELAELRLLNALRAGALALDDAETAEVERLIGQVGAGPAGRLGLPPDATVDEIRTVVVDRHTAWAVRAENPLSDPGVVHAARVMQRSYEAVLVEVAPTPS